MPTKVSIEDFKPLTITCEVRYQFAPLIFDRTGQVVEDLKDFFTEISSFAAVPQQSSFSSAEGNFGIESTQSRFSSGHIGRNGEPFARQCKAFFTVVTQRFKIDVFTRIGLRCIYRCEFKALDEAKAALATMSLANLQPTRRFNSSNSPTEVLLRWEDSAIGASVRLKAETSEIKFNVPIELQADVDKVDKKIVGLTLDVDYYTVAPVTKDQWNAEEWIVQKLRIMRKETSDIIEGGGR